MKKINNSQEIINLDNNYYLQITNDINNLPKNVSDIKKININKKQYKRLLKKILFLKIIVSTTKIEIGISNNSKTLLGYIINYNENNKEQKDFILAINAIFYANKYERYNYIYDTV